MRLIKGSLAGLVLAGILAILPAAAFAHGGGGHGFGGGGGFPRLKPYTNSSGVGEAAETNKKLGLLSLKRVLPGVTLVPSTSLVIRSEVSIFSLCGKILGPDEL